MGLFANVFGKAITKPVGRDQGAWSMIQGAWPSRWQESNAIFLNPTTQLAEQAYKHPIVRACVQVIATSMSEPRLAVGRERYNEWNEEKWHPVMDLLENPNPLQSCEELVSEWIARAELTGFGYIRKIRNKGKRVVQLYPIPTSWVTMDSASMGTSAGIQYRVWGSKELVPSSDMIVLKHFDPSSILGSSGPYQAVSNSHALDKEREDFLAEIFLNMQVPGLVFHYPPGFKSAKERKAAKKEISDALGRGNRGSFHILEGEGATLDMKAPLQDLDWPGLQGALEVRICVGFGVAPIIIGCRFGLEKSTYSNYEQAEKSFYTRTLRPKWNMASAVLTRSLMRDEYNQPDFRLRFMYDDLDQFSVDETAHVDRICKLVQAGIIGRSEARIEVGYTEPFPEEDEPKPLPFMPAFGPSAEGEDGDAPKQPTPPVVQEGDTDA